MINILSELANDEYTEFLFDEYCFGEPREVNTAEEIEDAIELSLSLESRNVFLEGLSERLENSFKESKSSKRIVLLHYPPLNADGSFNEFFDLCKEYKVSKLVYGHLHGVGHKLIKEGNIEGIEVSCVAGDYIDFMPVRIG